MTGLTSQAGRDVWRGQRAFGESCLRGKLATQGRCEKFRQTAVLLVDFDGNAAICCHCSAGFESGLGELELIVKLAVGGWSDVIAPEIRVFEFFEDRNRLRPTAPDFVHDHFFDCVLG